MNVFQELNRLLSSLGTMFNMSKWVMVLTKNQLVAVDKFITSNNWIKTGYEALIPISIGLMLMYCMVSLLEKTVVQEITMDDFVRFLIKFFMGSMLIKYGYSLLIGMLQLCEKMTTLVTIEADYTDVGARTVAKLGLIEIIVKLLELPGTMVGIIFMSVAVIFVMITRQVEIAVYTVMAPLALSDCMSARFFETKAFRFLKVYLSFALQSVIIVLVLYVASNFNSHLATSISLGIQTLGILKYLPKTGWFMFLNSNSLYALLIISLIFKSKSMARSLLGV